MIDVLKRAREFHELLSVKYADSSAHATRPEVKVLLTFMSRHETVLAQALKEYVDGASEKILESYFEATPDFDNLMATDSVHISPDARFEDVVDVALRYDEALMQIYRECEREAASDDLRDAIHGLLEMEKQEEIRVMRATLTG